MSTETSKSVALNRNGPTSSGRKHDPREVLGDDIWRSIVLKMDVESLLKLRKVSATFRDLVQHHMVETWDKWNAWKNQVPLYPPEVSGYSTSAKEVDKLLFEKLVCRHGPQTIPLGSFEKEGRRFVHWRVAAMRQNIPGVASSCRKGDFQYKSTFLKLPETFSFEALISSQPPEAQAVLDAVSLICYDCGQHKSSDQDCMIHNYCSACYEEKSQTPATWVAMLHRH